MLDALLVAVLALHLICVNIASAGPLVAIWLDLQAARGSELAGELGRFLCWLATLLLLAGSGLGITVGCLKWSPQYQELLAALARRIFFGSWEVLFSFLLMLICALWWTVQPGTRRLGRWIRNGLLALAATNLLYHFPFLFIVLSDLQRSGEIPQQPIDGREFRQLIASPWVIARVIHIWLASFAVTGVALVAHALWTGGPSRPRTQAIWGGRIALACTVLQLPVGVWLLTQMPHGIQQSLLGGDLMGTALLGASVLLSLAMLHTLAAVAFGETNRKTLIQSVLSMAAIVVMMTAVLERL